MSIPTKFKYLSVFAATWVAIVVVLAVVISADESEAGRQVVNGGALDRDCTHGGVKPDGGIQYIVSCPQASISPDGRWKLVQTPPVGPDKNYTVLVEASDGKRVASVTGLNDQMPFILHWSPQGDWFLINHYRGSGLQRPRIFQIKQDAVIEHRQHLDIAAKKARALSPCLPADSDLWIEGDGLKWSKDGRRLAWLFRTRPDMCLEADFRGGSIPSDKQWRPFMMISDVATGEIIEESIREAPADSSEVDFPTDGPYRNF